jgi:hypothetical protein
MIRREGNLPERKEPPSMKPLVLAVASLLLLSAVWAGTNPSAVPAAYSLAGGKNTKTPGSKATEKAATKTLKDKGSAKGKKLTFAGDVLDAGGGNLTIRTDGGDQVSFVVTPDTDINIPSLGKNATLEDLNPGVRVLVRATAGGDGSLTALQIHVVPGKPVEKHHVGEVTAYEPGVKITIKAHDGNEYTFLITKDTKILPAERADELAIGRRVTIISRRDPTGGPFTAQGIVVHPVPGEDEGTATIGATATETPTPTATPTPTNTPTPEVSPTEISTSTPTPS